MNTTAIQIISTRIALEGLLGSHVRDRLTPSRLAAFVHGVIASYYILQGNWHESILSTAQFFLLDMFLHYLLKTNLSKEMMFHHVCGAMLCIYSIVTQSYQSSPAEHLTKALILMETTNPVLQLLVTLRNENLQGKVNSTFLYILKFLFFFHFTYTRVLHLGRTLLLTYKHIYVAEYTQLAMFYLSSAMWILQLFWLSKIVQSVRNI